jgi:hypothetical protein
MKQLERQRGTALLLVILLGAGLMVLSALSLESTQRQSVTRRGQANAFLARQFAESGVAQGLARIKEGGFLTPMSGGGANPQWVNFGGGQFFYYSTYDAPTNVNVIRSWGRIPATDVTSTSTVAPDDVTWDGTGWMVAGIEFTLVGSKYIPEAPVYMGNGGIERPLGGFAWTGGADPADPSTWGTIASGPSSYQSSWIPFEASALDHPSDYIENGGAPAPAATPHPYNIWAAQNSIGQFNVQAWFANSGGLGYDPTINVTPPPTSTYYDTSDSSSPDYPYPIDPDLADVQTFAWELWNGYHADPAAVLLNQGQHSGTYGTEANPGVTFVTGELEVPSNQTFKGAGILVIRDNYDPNQGGGNTPSQRARLDINGKFEWTGLVIIAGWAPVVDVSSSSGAEATIVGALFGEDSVQSGGEVSLDSATIIMRVHNPFRVLYSRSMFEPGGLVYQYMPAVTKEVVGIKNL